MGPPEPAGPAVHARVAEVGMLEEHVRRPRRVEVVLGPGAVERRRPALAVDEEHVVALAVPHRARAVDVVVDAHVVALALDVGDQVVAVAGRVLPLRAEHRPLVLALGRRLGERVVVAGVEAPEVRGQARHLLVVDVVVEGVHLLGRVVLDLDARPARERHREVADHRAPLARPRGERQHRERVALVPALPEEVADRGLDARARLAVPVHAQDQVVAAQRGRGRRDRDPDVVDDTGALDLEERTPLAGGDAFEAVVVAARFVVAADAARLHAFLEPRELERRRAGALGVDGGCERESHEGNDGDGQGRVSHCDLLVPLVRSSARRLLPGNRKLK